MGQLTNQFVSQSYQGILNLANANTGFTTNLQTITDGLGGSSPLQISQTQVNISGTFTVNGAPVSVDTGSLVTTSSFNAYTSSVDLRFDGIELETGSLQNQINQKLDTGSFNAYTSSNDSKVNSLIANTGSYATTSSLTALSQSVAATDLAQDNRLTAIESITGSLATTGSLNSYTLTSSFNAYTSSNDSKVNSIISKTGSYATTGSNQFNGNQSISGSVQASSNITTLGGFVGTSYGSTVNATIYGDQLVDIKTQTTSNNGKVRLYSNGNYPFKVEVSGSLNVRDGITGSLQGTASYATQALSASWAPDNSNRNGLITTGSAGGNQSITGSLNVEGTISATSASFTYVNTVYETASVIYSSGSNQFGDASNDTQTLHGTVVLPDGQLNIDGTPTASIVLGQGSGAVAIENDTNGFVVTTDQQRLRVNSNGVEVTGSLNVTGGITGSLQGTASNAISSSHAINADTASFVQNAISSSYATNAATASIAYDVVVYGKCDNPGGLTRGTIVRITGANGDNPLFNSASWTDDLNSANTLGMLSEDAAYNSFANVVVQGTVIGINTTGMAAGDMLYLSSSGQYTTSSVPAPYHEVRLGQVLRANLNNGSAYVTIDNGYELTELHDVDITSPINGDLLVYRSGSYGQWVNETGGELGFATTGSNTFIGNQTITGSVTISGSAQVELDVKGDLINTGSLSVRSGSIYSLSNNTTINIDNYLTSSQAGQANIFLGWYDNTDRTTGAATNQANYTGSLRITGSNNIVSMPILRPTAQGGTADQTIYISGSGNMLLANNSGIYLNTGSLLLPKTQTNIMGVSSVINMTFTTSSLAGGHPIVGNNIALGGGMTLNHPSGSVNASTNTIIGGSITSTQTFTTNVRPTITSNNINGSVAINHISGSVNFNNNYVNAGQVLINNHVSSSNITNNGVNVTNNLLLGGSGGQSINLYLSGSQNSNASRVISDSIIGGRNVTVSSSFVSSSNANLFSSLIIGNGLTVSGSHTTGTNGGSAFVGRFNDTGSNLAMAQDIIFAVGTGGSAATRKTGFWIDSGSFTNVSGALSVKGATNALTVTGSGVISHIVAGQPALTVKGFDVGQPALLVSGSLNVTSSIDHTIIGSNINLNGIVKTDNKFLAAGANPLIEISGSNSVLRLMENSADGGAYATVAIDDAAGSQNNMGYALTTYTSLSGSHPVAQFYGGGTGNNWNGDSTIMNAYGGKLSIVKNTEVTGSMKLSSVMNLQPQNPLPAGNIGDLAVSSSNQLYFYNGAWTLVV